MHAHNTSLFQQLLYVRSLILVQLSSEPADDAFRPEEFFGFTDAQVPRYELDVWQQRDEV